MTGQEENFAFLPGDKVVEASTGREMTVHEVTDDGVRCVWPENGQPSEGLFAAAELKLVEEHS